MHSPRRHPCTPLLLLLPLALLAGCQDRDLPTDPPMGSPAFAQLPASPVVNSLGDPGDGTCDDTECTLREAIDFAAAGASITFAVTGTIALQDSITISKDLTITGPGASSLTVRRPQTDGTPAYRFLVVKAGTTVVVSHLTATGFFAGGTASGGVIHNAGTLTVTNVVLQNNSSARGGAVHNQGELLVSDSRIADNNTSGLFNDEGAQHMTVRRTTLSNNQASTDFGGGGILAFGVAIIEHSYISGNGGNRGGGVAIHGDVTITNTTITGNRASVHGGGIRVHLPFGRGEGRLTLRNSIVSNNDAPEGGGIAVGGPFTIEQSTVTGNTAVRGGGIDIDRPVRIEVRRTRISGNSASEGGGIYCICDFMEAALVNSTVSGNSATSSGGGFLLTGGEVPRASISHTTFHGNTAPTGAAIHAKTRTGFTVSGFLYLRSTLIAGAAGTNNCRADLAMDPMSIVDEGNNIESGTTCGFTHAASMSSTDALLGPLADNGGPTWTHALLPGSPAIDAGTCVDNGGATVAVDQRGVTRPQGAGCDIGAFELEPQAGYEFLGFFAPVANPNHMNVARAGQIIPLKWRLLDASGSPVTTLTSATASVASLACSAGSSTDAVQEYASGNSGLQNLGNGYYQFNWSTPRSYAGSCKTMSLELGVGATRTALFQFTR